MASTSSHLANLLSSLLILQVVRVEGAWFDDPFYDLRGQSFCSTIRPSCCTSRKDDCSVPVLGTLCYCDEFCSKHNNPDCCPDYEEVCHGISPPTNLTQNRCWINGDFYNPGDTLKINCKQCTCVDKGYRTEIQCDTSPCIVEEDIVNRINQDYRSRRLTWEASNYSEFWGHKLEEGFRMKLGTLHSRRKVATMRAIPVVPSKSLPRTFEANSKWPGWISEPEDQGWCGASWVYSTIGVASDRWSIMSNGRFTEGLSFQHLLGCNSLNQKGCNGGHLTRAWQFIKKYGIVKRSCYHYTGSTTRCLLPKHKNATSARCESSSVRQPLYRVSPVYRVSGEDAIKQEIFNNGPVQATMRVFRDMFLYKQGVYSCTKSRSEKTGFHSIRIVGWGEEYIHGRTIPYWLIANSWGTWWGERGYIKVKRGSNECGIEDFVLGVWADTSKLQFTSRSPDYNSLSNSIS